MTIGATATPMGADLSSMTWENLTADADALRQALGFDKWAVLGHSFGGQVALEYALRYPQSLSHLVLMDTCGDNWWVQENAPEILAQRGYSAAAVKRLAASSTGRSRPTKYFPALIKFARAYFYRLNPWQLAQRDGLGPRHKVPTRSHASSGTASCSTAGRSWTGSARSKCPALVMAGRHDFLFPPEHQAILADRIPNADLELIERAGHNPHKERTAEVIRAIRDFVGAPTPSPG